METRKINLSKPVLTLIFVLGFFVNVSSQAISEEWQLLTSENNISVYGLKSSCDGNEVVLLKIINENLNVVSVSWSLWGEEIKTIEINPKDTASGGCESTARFELNNLVPEGKSFDDMNPVITFKQL